MFEIPGGSIQVGIFDFHLSYKKDSLKSETGVEPYLLDFCDVIQIVECTCKETSKLTTCPSVSTESVTIEGVVNTDGQVDVVRWTKVQTDPPGTYRKEIVLPNDYLLSGTTTDDRIFPLVTLSKKDKVEIGTPEVPMNLNTPSRTRPTVTELGQAKAHEVAYLSDIPEQVVFKSDIRNNLTEGMETRGTVLDARQGRVLKEMIDNLETRIQALESQNPLILEK